MEKKNKVDTGGQRLNLFPSKKHKKKSVDSKVFDMMESAASDKTNVDITNIGKNKTLGKDTKSIHNALMAAGMTPVYGNIADMADATLYALEGELGDAAWSLAAAIPVIGQMVAGKKALKVAKEAGEEMITLYRGVGKWHPGKMVKDGKFVGGDKYSPTSIFATRTKKAAHQYGGYIGKGKRIFPEGRTLEFEVPKSFFDKYAKIYIKDLVGTPHEAILFKKGIPKEFLKKVHK